MITYTYCMEPIGYGLLICRRLNWTRCQCIGSNLVPRASALIARQKTWDNPTWTQYRTHAIVGSGYEIFSRSGSKHFKLRVLGYTLGIGWQNFFKTHSQAKIHRKACGVGLSSENALFVAISPISCSFWNFKSGCHVATISSGKWITFHTFLVFALTNQITFWAKSNWNIPGSIAGMTGGHPNIGLWGGGHRRTGRGSFPQSK